jgi:hypothetical protein
MMDFPETSVMVVVLLIKVMNSPIGYEINHEDSFWDSIDT